MDKKILDFVLDCTKIILISGGTNLIINNYISPLKKMRDEYNYFITIVSRNDHYRNKDRSELIVRIDKVIDDFSCYRSKGANFFKDELKLVKNYLLDMEGIENKHPIYGGIEAREAAKKFRNDFKNKKPISIIGLLLKFL